MNISIIGSRHTLDIFDDNKNKKMEKEYKIASYIPMVSMLSLMSEPVLYNYRRLSMLEIDECKFERLFYDLEKNVLNTLESVQPDVIVIDFYADARFGALLYGSEYITNEISDLIGKGIIFAKNLGITYNYDSNTEDYIMVWKNYFDRFMAYMTENLPEVQIIINAMKMPDSHMNMISSYSDMEIERINMLWNAFDKYAIKKYNLKHMVKDKVFLIDNKFKKHMQENNDLLFKKEYYIQAYKDFKIAIKNTKHSKKKESHRNLIIDSDFSRDLLFWSIQIGKYEFIKYRGYQGIKVIDCREQLGEYSPQVWTRAIEIMGDGETEYTLSFYITIPDISKFDEDSIIFRIRVFDDIKSITSKDAVDGYILTLKNRMIKSKEEYRYVFTFKPKGKYIKVAPFLTECILGVEYNRIKLERSSKESEYSK